MKSVSSPLPTRVLKFGGTSLQDGERIERVAAIVAEAATSSTPVVVVSAVGDITDRLHSLLEWAVAGAQEPDALHRSVTSLHLRLLEEVALPHELPLLSRELEALHHTLQETLEGAALLREASPRMRDELLAGGELASATLVAAALRRRGVAAREVDARTLIVTDARHGEARVLLDPTTTRVRSHLPGGDGIPVVTGFIGATPEGVTTTLGRGGSDYTGTLLGALLGAEEVEIWTDVDGVLTADPRSVPDAVPLRELIYDELEELSRFGARVMYPPAVQPVRDAGIPLRIRSTLAPLGHGTRVVRARAPGAPPLAVQSVTSIRSVVLLRLRGVSRLGLATAAERSFRALGRAEVTPLLFTQDSSAHSLTFAAHEDHLREVEGAFREEFRPELDAGLLEDLFVETECSLLALVGDGMRSTPGIAGRLFRTLGEEGVNVRAIAQGASERNISCVVHRRDLDHGLRAVHAAFLHDHRDRYGKPHLHPGNGEVAVGPANVSIPHLTPLRIALVGAGRVGGALLDHLHGLGGATLRAAGVDPQIVAISRSRVAAYHPTGLPLGNWRSTLADGREDPARVLERLRAPGPAVVLVDATADPAMGAHYPALLAAGVSIVSANKFPFSGTLHDHEAIHEAARAGGGRVRHETTAGAALPWIGTLRRFREEGDTVLSLEGAFSGTLTYLFDAINRGRPFSEALREASREGITEPDPRADLELLDVVRKLVILARAAGYPLESDEVAVEKILPDSLMAADSIPSFLEALPQVDEEMAHRGAEAARNGSLLLPVARFSRGGPARVGLEEVPAAGPYAGLRGTENVLILRSHLYDVHPFVIRGPGAGPEITARGLFRDLMTLLPSR